MNLWLIITILLVIISLAVILFGNETVGHKMYKAMGAAAMSVIGVLSFKFIAEGIK